MAFIDPVPSFVSACDKFCTKHKMSRARLSTILLSHGQRLDQLAQGDSSMTFRVLDEANKKLKILDEERSAMAKREVA